jgi:molybdenum cofactor biosynthesis protein MoaC
MLTHIDKNGNATMVDVNDKSISNRIAKAQGEILVTKDILDNIKDQSLKKGDLFTVAKVAGINAAKNTSQLIPLCHQVPLDSIDIEFTVNDRTSTITVSSIVKTSYKTGVEMEALVAVNITLLTIYDMCKAVSKDMEIRKVELIHKSGGKSGHWGSKI